MFTDLLDVKKREGSVTVAKVSEDFGRKGRSESPAAGFISMPGHVWRSWTVTRSTCRQRHASSATKIIRLGDVISRLLVPTHLKLIPASRTMSLEPTAGGGKRHISFYYRQGDT